MPVWRSASPRVDLAAGDELAEVEKRYCDRSMVAPEVEAATRSSKRKVAPGATSDQQNDQ
jgi:hypothetical protein